MLRLLQSANPIAFIFLIIYFIGLNVHPFLSDSYGEIKMSTAFFEWLFIEKLQMQLMPPFTIYCITAICIFLQGILISILLRYFKIIPKFSLIPATVSYLLYYLFDECIAFTPLLVLNFIFLLLLTVLFKAYNIKNADTTFFNTGLLHGFMSILYFPSLIFSIFSMYTAFNLRSSSFRELVIFISGFITFLFLIFTACFWFDNIGLMINSIIVPFSQSSEISGNIVIASIKLFSVVCFLISALIFIRNRSVGNLIQIRKYLTSIFMYLLFSISSGFLYSSLSIPAFSLTIIPIAMIIGYQLSLMKNKDGAEMVHLTLLAIVFTFQYINFA